MIPDHQLHTEAGARERIIPACVVTTTFVFRRRATGVNGILQQNQWILRTSILLNLQGLFHTSCCRRSLFLTGRRSSEAPCYSSVAASMSSARCPGLLRPPVPGPGAQQAAHTPSTGPVQVGG
ncbi:unnamed protein product [Pleuronectes platessa]|uniref:Uncharacterized protein n=1 Tax=Pleuronectes platessa TaxID=8262 RepID=A0A9N7ZCK1_PLEPL|nr:unnamed protein product [Pleuronectes platessa]